MMLTSIALYYGDNYLYRIILCCSLSSIALYYGGTYIELYCVVHFSGEIHRLFYRGNVRSMEQ